MASVWNILCWTLVDGTVSSHIVLMDANGPILTTSPIQSFKGWDLDFLNLGGGKG